MRPSALRAIDELHSHGIAVAVMHDAAVIWHKLRPIHYQQMVCGVAPHGDFVGLSRFTKLEDRSAWHYFDHRPERLMSAVHAGVLHTHWVNPRAGLTLADLKDLL